MSSMPQQERWMFNGVYSPRELSVTQPEGAELYSGDRRGRDAIEFGLLFKEHLTTFETESTQI